MRKLLFLSVFLPLIFPSHALSGSLDVYCASQGYQVRAGWNLIGISSYKNLPVDLLIGPTCPSVWGWTGQSWEVNIYNYTELDAYLQSKGFTKLNYLQATKGYWLNCIQNGYIFITPVENYVLENWNEAKPKVTAGWNLVASTFNGQIKPIEFIAGHEKKINSMWKWGPYSQKWKVYLPNSSQELNQQYAKSKGFEVMEDVWLCEGIWINVDQSEKTTLTLSPQLGYVPPSNFTGNIPVGCSNGTGTDNPDTFELVWECFNKGSFTTPAIHNFDPTKDKIYVPFAGKPKYFGDNPLKYGLADAPKVWVSKGTAFNGMLVIGSVTGNNVHEWSVLLTGINYVEESWFIWKQQ